MSDRPEVEWAMAKAMYEFENMDSPIKWEDLLPGNSEQLRYLMLAQTAFQAFMEKTIDLRKSL